MKKLMIPILTVAMLFSSASFAQTKAKTVTQAPAKVSKPVEAQKEKYFKVDWFVKKTGKVVVTRSTVIHMNDPENQAKTGKIVFSPQKIPVGNSQYFLGLGLDMKLFENKGSPVLAMVGLYTDPNPLFDFTEKMPDEQNVAHVVVQPENKKFSDGQSVNLNTAKFVKAYDISKPSNQEVVLTRFIIKEPDTASLIEVSFKVYEFEVSEQDKPKD